MDTREEVDVVGCFQPGPGVGQSWLKPRLLLARLIRDGHNGCWKDRGLTGYLGESATA